jgi:hypothetical protein
VLDWIQYGIPGEMILSVFGVALGLVQFLLVYGLWTGRSWSYKGTLALLVVLIVQDVVAIAMYDTAPAMLGLNTSVLIGQTFGNIFFFVVYRTYLRLPHVKEYLHVLPPPTAS